MAFTDKQKLFIEAYLANGFNATKAAKAAKYKGDDATLAAVGYENLRKPQIAETISARVAAMAMPADEALARLAQIARGDLGEFIGKADSLKEHPQSHLLKTFNKRIIPMKSGGEITEIEIGLYDAQAALVQILKQHQLAQGKPTEIVEVNDARERIARRLDSIAAARRADGDPEQPDG